MKLKLTMRPENKSMVKDVKSRHVGDLLGELALDREVYVFRKNGEVVTEAEPLKAGDQIDVIKVVSGG